MLWSFWFCSAKKNFKPHRAKYGRPHKFHQATKPVDQPFEQHREEREMVTLSWQFAANAPVTAGGLIGRGLGERQRFAQTGDEQRRRPRGTPRIANQ
jgi:hypothetical protein